MHESNIFMFFKISGPKHFVYFECISAWKHFRRLKISAQESNSLHTLRLVHKNMFTYFGISAQKHFMYWLVHENNIFTYFD